MSVHGRAAIEPSDQSIRPIWNDMRYGDPLHPNGQAIGLVTGALTSDASGLEEA